MLWIITLIIAIGVLFVFWWYGTYHDHDSVPTMHAECQLNSCGGDLVCDLGCNRCKKSLDGDCSTDTDCEFGLYCHKWKCSTEPHISHDIPLPLNNIIEKKVVKWDDNNNETYSY